MYGRQMDISSALRLSFNAECLRRQQRVYQLVRINACAAGTAPGSQNLRSDHGVIVFDIVDEILPFFVDEFLIAGSTICSRIDHKQTLLMSQRHCDKIITCDAQKSKRNDTKLCHFFIFFKKYEIMTLNNVGISIYSSDFTGGGGTEIGLACELQLYKCKPIM